MSLDCHSSTETLVVDLWDIPKIEVQPHLDTTVAQDMDQTSTLDPLTRKHTSSIRTSQETLVEKVPPKKAKKEKKASKIAAPPSKPIKEKLCEQIAQNLASQLSNGAPFTEASDVLRRFLQPRQPATSRLAAIFSSNTSSCSSSTTQVDHTSQPSLGQSRQSCIDSKLKPKYRRPGEVFCLDEVSTYTYLEKLVRHYGKVSHMGVLDSSYSLFLNKAKDGALLFKIYDSVAIVSGDPLCEWHRIEDLLAEFAAYRKQLSLDITFLGASAQFAKYAESRKWVTMQFGVEKVLNPVTNPIVLEAGAGKRTITSCKALLKKGTTLGVYIPKHGVDETLQEEIMEVYDAWCADRNSKPIIQAYVSVMDPLAMPGIMTYLYSRAEDGSMNGFVALRRMGRGYHVDPCVAKPSSTRGITELLIISALSIFHSAGVDFLSLGFDPSPELGEITGIPRIALRTTRSIHRRSVENLPVGGKQTFYDKFHPDESMDNNMYVVIPTRGLPKLRHMKAIMHNANIDISSVLRENLMRSLRPAIGITEMKQKAAQSLDQSNVGAEIVS